MMYTALVLCLMTSFSFAIIPTTVSPQAQEFLRTQSPFKIAPKSEEGWKRKRQLFHDFFMEASEKSKQQYVLGSEKKEIAGIPVTIVTPKNYDHKNDNQIILYLHGGGYTFGSPDCMYSVFAPVAFETGVKVYAVDYSLAPEHPFPQGLNDSLNVYKSLLKTFSPKQIVFLGDSAGGGLALATALKAQDENLPLPAAIGLYSPWTDITKTGDTYHTLENLDPILNYEKNLKATSEVYVGKMNPKKPLISPVYATYSKEFPKTLLQTGTRDLFLSNNVRLYRKMKNDGVDVQLDVWEGMWHVFEGTPDLPEAKEAAQQMAEFFKKSFE